LQGSEEIITTHGDAKESALGPDFCPALCGCAPSVE
jgi:hypothetical protein